MTRAALQTKSDAQLQEEVLSELKWDTRVQETEVGVTVNRGVVTLTGTVNSFAKKLAAKEAAHRVAGVLDVANDLQVKLPGDPLRTDAEIAGAIRLALEWDVWVPEEDIQSTVSNGWVTLEGTARLARERDDAERAILGLAGVRGVTNKIVVNGPEIEHDEIRELIEDALERRAEREADRIEVTIEGSQVKLSGRVHSWAERRAVLGTVSHARGVKVVEENLRVDPGF